MKPKETPCLITFSDKSTLVCSLETVAKYKAIYGDQGNPPFEVSAIPQKEEATT